MLFGPTCKSQLFLVSPSFNVIFRLPTASAMTANQSQVFSQALDYYLGEGVKYIPELHKLSKEDTKEADDKILR